MRNVFVRVNKIKKYYHLNQREFFQDDIYSIDF